MLIISVRVMEVYEVHTQWADGHCSGIRYPAMIPVNFRMGHNQIHCQLIHGRLHRPFPELASNQA